jgi:Secretion system C-terminal sorting domain
MKKIILIIGCIVINMAAIAQVTVSMDTVYSVMDRDFTAKPIITITNGNTTDFTFNWSIDSANCVLPSGFSCSGVCSLPGLCYPFKTGNHVYTMPANTSMILEPSVYLSATADITKAGWIFLNTDINGGKQLAFKFNGQEWATSIKNTKPNRIHLEMYPMPSTTILNVVHNNNKVAKAILFNVLGKKIMEYYTPVNANGFSINTADLSDGMYILDVRDNTNHSLATQRFTKN